MSITIEAAPRTFFVRILEYRIITTVTSSAAVVDEWIVETLRLQRRHLADLVVGLDLKVSKSGRVSLVTFCIGHRALIYQIFDTKAPSPRLEDFLKDERFEFCIPNIDLLPAAFEVLNLVDLGSEASSRPDLAGKGPRKIARAMLGLHLPKEEKGIRQSAWDAVQLTYNQVSFATVDANLSYRIGKAFRREERMEETGTLLAEVPH